MKRQVESVANCSEVAVKKEEGDDDRNSRKRIRTSRQIAERAMAEIDGKENGIHFSDDEKNADHLTVHFFEAQTSTPISQNGSTLTKNTVQSFPFASISSACDIAPMPAEMSNIDATTNGGVDDCPVNGVGTENHGDSEDMGHPDKQDNIVIDDNQEKAQHELSTDQVDTFLVDPNAETKTIATNIEVEETQASTEVEYKECAWTGDVDTFMNSFLQVSTLIGHADDVLSVAADGDIILSASADTTIKMWNPDTKKEIRNFQGHTAAVTAVVLLSNEQSQLLAEKMNFRDVIKIAISASLDCSIRLWDISSGSELANVYTFNGITCLEYLEEGKQVVIGTEGGKLEIWDMCASEVVYTVLAHENGITSLKVDDCYICTTSTDGMVKGWLLEDNELHVIYTRRRKQASGNKSQLESSAWLSVACHDGLMYLGDRTSNLKILDWKAGRLRMLKNQIQSNGIIDAVCVKGDVLLSSYYDVNSNAGGINVWQLPNMKYACTLSGEEDHVTTLAMTMTENKVLRVVSGGKMLHVWDFISTKLPSKECDAKYYCQEIESLGEEMDESTGGQSPPHGDVPDKAESEKKQEEKTSGKMRCIVM